MAADERRIRADIEEELKEFKMEKEALRNALRLIASENATTNAAPSPPLPPQLRGQGTFIQFPTSVSHSRSSFQVGTKSRPQPHLRILFHHPLRLTLTGFRRGIRTHPGRGRTSKEI